MKIVITPWAELSLRDVEAIKARSKAPEHDNEEGRPSWASEAGQHFLYVPIVYEGAERFLPGIFGAGGPLNQIIPSWWIDKRYRGKGYSQHAIGRFANYLVEHGVTGVGGIAIHASGEDFQKSAKLARRFRSYFRRVSIDSNCLTYLINAMKGIT